MRLRPKIITLLLLLSLIPLLAISLIAYYNGVTSLRRIIGSYFQFVARRSIEKIDAKVFEIAEDVRRWTELEFMQDVVAGDVDGRIVSFLVRAQKEYGIFSRLDVLNLSGEVIASSSSPAGQSFSRERFFGEAMAGVSYIGDMEQDPVTREGGMDFAFPIRSAHEQGRGIIGVVRAHWRAQELSQVLETSFIGGVLPVGRILLLRKDGLVIAGTKDVGGLRFEVDLSGKGFESIRLARQQKEGYLLERKDAEGKNYFIGYSYSQRYGDLKGLGWTVLVVQEAGVVFVPVTRLSSLIAWIFLVVVACVILIALKASKNISRPVLKMAYVAERVANGDLDLEQEVRYTGGDELGILAEAFNRMIKDLKDHRMQLLREKAHIHSIISNMADALFVVDADGMIQMVNDRAAQLSGYTREELTGQSLHRLFVGAGAELILKKVAADHAIRSDERTFLTQENREIPVEFSASVMFDDDRQIRGIVCLVHDITDRKRIERLIHEAEAHKAVIVDSAMDCIISINHEGRITEFNPAAERVFGFSRKEVIGREMADAIIPPPLREGHRRGMARYLATGEGPVLNKRLELTALRCDGSEFPVELSIVRIPAQGPPVFTGYLRDITERKHSEEEIKKVMQMKDEFVSTVSHELRTPLAISKEGLSLLRRGKAGEMTSQQKEIVEMAASNIDRLAFLIDDILDVSKIEAGKMPLYRESVDAAELVQENCRGWALRVKAKEINFCLDVPPKSIILDIDKMRFMQILSNLISNAFKFTPEKGKITVTVEEEEAGVKFSVIDTGVGIPQEDLPRLFEKFYQGERTYGPGMYGTGLGLNIVKSLVELHGGRISVVSEPGKGSTFSFIVPKPGIS